MVVGGGLFGDLPAAKNDSSKATNSAADDSKKTTTASNAATTTGATATNDAAPAGKKPAALPSLLIPTQQQKKKKTVMAFLPAALKRKRPPQPGTKVVAASASAPPPVSAPLKSQADCSETKPNAKEVTQKTEISSTVGVIDIHGQQQQQRSVETETPLSPKQQTAESATAKRTDQLDAVPFSHMEAPRPVASIPEKDLYDPAVPNDLLQYWERARAARERQRLQQERADQLRQQEALRQAAKREREALASQGQYEALAQRHFQAGRGRGVSNVPAWMLKQQQRDPGEPKAADDNGDPAPKRFKN